MLWTSAAAASSRPPAGPRRKGDPLYAARRTLHTGSDLLTDKQRQRLTALFADDEHVEVEATWGIYQHMIAAYREPDRKRGRELMQQLIGSIGHSVPTALREVITLGRTLKTASRGRAGLLRPARHLQRADRGDQRPPRTSPRLSPRLPQPHQLHRQIASGDRRLQAPTTPSIMKSPFTLQHHLTAFAQPVHRPNGRQNRGRRACADGRYRDLDGPRIIAQRPPHETSEYLRQASTHAIDAPVPQAAAAMRSCSMAHGGGRWADAP